MTSPHLGIMMPAFLGPEFDQAWDAVADALGLDNRAYKLFSLAWFGLGYRARTSVEYSARYVQLPPYGRAGQEGNFREDQALVDYLFCVCSGIDCIAYSMFAIGSGLDPNLFPTEKPGQLQLDRRQIGPRFVTRWPNDALTEVADIIRTDKTVELLYAIRDVVTHRGTLPRTLAVGDEYGDKVTFPANVKDLPDLWTSDLQLGAAAVTGWQSAFEKVCRRTVSAVLAFQPIQPNSTTNTDA
jgi:hypothetical protein